MSERPEMERDDDLLAAEYALRLLEGDELVAFERRLRAEPELAGIVAAWRERLVPMDAETEPVPPPPALKPRLEGALFGEADRPREPGSLLAFWRGLSMAALALAAVLGILLLRPEPVPPDGGPILTAEIASEDASLRLIAVYDAAGGQLRLSRTAGKPPQGRALELWAIAGDEAPISLGVLPEAPSAVVRLPDGLRPPPEGVVLAVSDEPMGGSPTGQPTGPVLALGEITGI
jgi:anti-sigma-K factor RskA